MDRRRSRLRAAVAAFASNAGEPVAPPRPAAPGAVHLMAEAADGIRTIVRNRDLALLKRPRYRPDIHAWCADGLHGRCGI